jgi:Ni/Co efflux regulator RcnB
MNIKTAAFALLLLAGTAPAALAQPDQGEGPRERGGEAPRHPGGETHDRGNWEGRGGGWRQAQPQQAPAPAAPPQARPAPAAPESQGPRGDRFQSGGRWQRGPQGQPGGQPGGGDGGQARQRPGRWVDREGDNPGQGLTPGDRADHEDRQELHDWRRLQGARPDQGGRDGHWRGDGRSGDGPRGDRQGDHRGDGDRWNGRDGDQRWNGDRRNDGNWDRRRGDWNRGDRRGDWDRGDHGRPQWRAGAYPHSFHSARRYHIGAYRRPPHFYTHVWSFGEFLPGTWFGPDYLIDEWWDYDLPAPPPGYDWVRVGDDALLVDEYTGRIVQVVRNLFW